MLAAVVEQIGRPPRPGEVDAPRRGADEALVAVHAASLNPIEVRIAAGRFARPAQPPYVPGLEGAGTVVEADAHEPGRRVRVEGRLPGFGASGTLAQLVAVPEAALVELPDGVDDATAAALGTVGITAELALDRARLAEGESVLVLGATGAVGQMAVQLARLHGAGRVVAAGRSAERLARARELGADAAVELAESTAEEALRDAAGGPIDVVIDVLWGRPAMAALGALATEGRLVNVGESAGTDVQVALGPLRNKQGAILTLSSGWSPLEVKLRAYRKVLDHVANGRVTVDHERVPLAEIESAWERQAGSPGKKLVIEVDSE
jgi:NADPH2:quinone reductase